MDGHTLDVIAGLARAQNLAHPVRTRNGCAGASPCAQLEVIGQQTRERRGIAASDRVTERSFAIDIERNEPGNRWNAASNGPLVGSERRHRRKYKKRQRNSCE